MNPQLRIGDEEREAAISALGEHFAAGRIDEAEYEERSSTAWAARTAGDLTPLFADLPEPNPTSRARAAQRPRASETAPRPWPPAWGRVGLLAVIGLLIALAVVTRLPWFLILIAVWVVCFKVGRFGGPRSRHWRHARGWGPPGRWS